MKTIKNRMIMNVNQTGSAAITKDIWARQRVIESGLTICCKGSSMIFDNLYEVSIVKDLLNVR